MGRGPGLRPAGFRRTSAAVIDRQKVTVVVPTHNRRAAVLRLLEALAMQTASPATFHAVVVVDGSTDDTAEALRARTFPFPLEVVQQPALGPAAARNEGARRAAGRILLFLDDDVQPDAQVIAAHLALHAEAENRVGIGMLPPVAEGDALFPKILRFWWMRMQETLLRSGHRFSFKDLLSGHFSIARSRFDALGGFDPALRCHEDYELGFRAIQAGMDFRVARGTRAFHHDDTTIEKVFRRKLEEGMADVALGRRHPALVGGLPFAWEGHTSRKKRALIRAAWSASTAGDAVARSLQGTLPMYEAASLRFRWRRLLEALLDYWYWRGIAAVLHRPGELRALLATAPKAPEPLTVDLAPTIAAAEAALDEHRPAAARLRLGDEPVATIPAYAGYERLRGAHLRPLLARWCSMPYLQAAARRGQIPEAFLPLPRTLDP